MHFSPKKSSDNYKGKIFSQEPQHNQAEVFSKPMSDIRAGYKLRNCESSEIVRR